MSPLEMFEQRAGGVDGDVVGCRIEEVGVAGDQQVGCRLRGLHVVPSCGRAACPVEAVVMSPRRAVSGACDGVIGEVQGVMNVVSVGHIRRLRRVVRNGAHTAHCRPCAVGSNRRRSWMGRCRGSNHGERR